ncbi:SDR family oxidoreductase [Ferrimonas sediminicola]|uniref:SDR family oxidoreductase n=1 Tax=Ferrimonas sediminicola TaxID=2569538 RepID=A0A4V5NWK8_9GAMM|nr:SDR family oxidoreductase [Ferrimonas sediminicola]TKB47283.1 SDR family oxidoreductase [Ferrimonas sediminicola]
MQPVAVVTGCGRRLGAHLTRRLLQQGYRVFGQYLTSEPDADPRLSASRVDLTDDAETRDWCDQLLAQTDRVDLLINNASLYQVDAQRLEQGIEQLQRFHRLHLQAPYILVRRLQRALSNASGCVVNLTDIYVHHPNADYSLYCATKAGLDSLAQSWARQLAPRVRVNTIEPGPILFLEEHGEAYRQQVLSRTLLEVEGGLEPIWQALWMLVNNPYMTGARIPVDGGRGVAQL